jgi:hypothetical protein
MTTVEALIKRLQEDYKPTTMLAVAMWGIEDVQSRAKERRIYLSKAAAQNIIDYIDNEQDATQGINWDTLDCATDKYLDDHPQVQYVCPDCSWTVKSRARRIRCSHCGSLNLERKLEDGRLIKADADENTPEGQKLIHKDGEPTFWQKEGSKQ